MAKETRIRPEHLAQFLPWLADNVLVGIAKCMGKGWDKWVKGEPIHKLKPEEWAEVERAANTIVMALQMGLLLAKRQPELGDAAIGILESRGVSADEIWKGIIETYGDYLKATGNEHWGKDRISPSHFGEFLAYYASNVIKEMSRHMDKEWKKGWQKRENPLKLKRGEEAKVVTVGNRAAFAILTSLVIGERQPDLLSADWSRGASLDTLWDGMLSTYRDFCIIEYLVDRKVS